ncbi:molybdopterin converting factor subunit 1 [Alkalihalophilus lindianensis]|uniref:Molybdopterin synthase sulfur carrier subunit n=1 Tax=Alkalihalophilus lindianensis TaxID=1630542 RepID=A0ABU3XDQ9_9BACI|nr:molybdopterin converting factor subunit 1 [Alkalihalophilus lindianensis]MDV2686018.1 molybdopterin converting factor subunit 1 [Alkalihalophilus lindianensis]
MIRLLLFAEFQEQAGTDQVEIDQAGLTVAELKSWLKQEYRFTSLDQTMIAINETYANETDVLKDGDVIALIPPVSGG